MNAIINVFSLIGTALITICLFALCIFFSALKFERNAHNLLRKDALNSVSSQRQKGKTIRKVLVDLADIACKNRIVSIIQKKVKSVSIALRLAKNIDETTYEKLAQKFQVDSHVVHTFEGLFPFAAAFLLGMVLEVVTHTIGGIYIGLLTGLFLGAIVCNKTLEHCEKHYRTLFESEVPSMMSMIILAIQAGASFDMAFNAYGTRCVGLLAQEAQQTYALYISQVMTRNDALDQMAQKVDVDIFYRFVATVKRALYLGSPLSLALEHQLSDVRVFRTEKIKEEIAKKPIQILLPLGLFILPSMLILLLGPVLMEVMQGISMG